MRTVHKFPLTVNGRQTIVMPEGAEVSHVGLQGSTVCLWALVDTEKDYKPRTFTILGTGQPLDVPGGDVKPVGSFMVADGEFVFHVVEHVDLKM